MALTAEQIYGFTHSLLMANFDNPQPTPEVHREMWEHCCSDHQYVALAAPRGHAKSTAITHSYLLAAMLFRDRQFGLIVSDTEGQAVLFLSDIKRELIENEQLRTLFGIKRFRKDQETDIIVEFDDGHMFRIIAKGSEQKVRGLKWRGSRPDIIVGDDLENDEIVMNEERRAKFRRWMNNALLPSLADNGVIRIVGTILHLDAFLEHCMPQFEDKDTETDGIKWWSNNKEKTWLSVRYQGHNEDFTKLLWPEKFSERRYKAIRKRYVDAGNPEGYAQEYLNYPIDEESAFFRKDDFLPMKESDRETYMEFYVGGDLAISEKDQRAYSVFVVCGLTRDNILNVVDVIRFRGDALRIIDEMLRIQRVYEPEIFWLEEENIARSIGSVIDQAMLQSGVFINIKTMTPTKDKMQRARGIQARMRAGAVRFNTKADWYAPFFQEMVTFPRGKYVDQVDAFSWIGLGLNQVIPTFTAREIAAYEWDDEYGDDYESLQGRSVITGY